MATIKTSHHSLVLPTLQFLGAAVLAGSVMSCSGGSSANYYTYCVNPVTGQIINPVQCQYFPGIYYYYMGPYGLSYGHVVPRSSRTGSAWFRVNNASARTKAGLPATGSVPHGYKVSSSSGGFDGSESSESGGSSSHGSSGSGGHGSSGGSGSHGASAGHGTSGG